MTLRHGRRTTRRRVPHLAFLLAVVTAAVMLQATPAAALGDTDISDPDCSNYNGVYECVRRGVSWDTNSTNKDVLGPRGIQHTVVANYSPNNTKPNHDVYVGGTSDLWDRTGAAWQRMRLYETYKALNSSGFTLSVGWGALDLSGTDPMTVSNTVVTLSMTRQAPMAGNHIGRNASLSFPHHWQARYIEHVSNGTIEYAATNATYRLQTRLLMTDY